MGGQVGRHRRVRLLPACPRRVHPPNLQARLLRRQEGATRPERPEGSPDVEHPDDVPTARRQQQKGRSVSTTAATSHALDGPTKTPYLPLRDSLHPPARESPPVGEWREEWCREATSQMSAWVRA